MLSDPLQIIAIAVIGVIFIVAIFGVGKKQGFLAQFASIAPNTLTFLSACSCSPKFKSIRVGRSQ